MSRELYKKSIDNNDRQELRRQKLLEQQKLKRLEQQDEQRCLENEQRLKNDHKKSRSKGRYKQRTFHDLYGDDISLQLSEWLREKPEDLSEWLLVPCPKGQRCLVVASRGNTKMFSKAGLFRMSFKSSLPGGGERDVKGGGGFCILDCIYNDEVDSFFVLDVLWYGKQCFLDCEAQFRFFWLKCKFDELEDENGEPSQKRDHFKAFHLLKTCRIENEVATACALQRYPLWTDNLPELDGFLFYHNEASYTCGPTPLVCWLFPFMVEDVLHMTVNSVYERPPNYSNPWLYMEEFDKELARKRQKRQTKQMDYANDTDSVNSSTLSLSQADKDMEGIDDDDEGELELQKRRDKDCTSLDNLMKSESVLELEGISMY